MKGKELHGIRTNRDFAELVKERDGRGGAPGAKKQRLNHRKDRRK